MARRDLIPAAGAIVIGARMPLIAFNINLATDRLDVAKKIASAIRHSSGGFRFVKAMGIALDDRGIVQVSINLTNYEKTPMHRVFDAVRREAERYGVAVLESEIIGLTPQAALVSAAEHYLQLARFSSIRSSRTGSAIRRADACSLRVQVIAALLGRRGRRTVRLPAWAAC